MHDYTTVTELPGSQITKLQLKRSYSRYKFAQTFCEGKVVLEVACGGGQGLGLLAEKALKVVGGDCDRGNLAHAYETYKGNEKVEILEIDAHSLNFEDNSFDVVILYEAIYYLSSPEAFLKECRRVLRADGALIICTANKNWPDFNPSSFSHRYYSVPELRGLLSDAGFKSEFFGAFPDSKEGLADGLKSMIKRAAVRLRLMPKTMKGKVLLKRLFYGNMVVLPGELIDGQADYAPPTPISAGCIDSVHTAIYAVARPLQTPGLGLPPRKPDRGD